MKKHLIKTLMVLSLVNGTFCSEKPKDAEVKQAAETREDRIERERINLRALLDKKGIVVPTSEQSRAYGDTQIDSKLMLEMASQTPKEVVTSLQGVFNDAPQLWSQLLGDHKLIGKPGEVYKQFHPQANAALVKLNLQNLSNYNYVFRIPGQALIAKIAGHVLRNHTIRRLADVLKGEPAMGKYGRSVSGDDYDLFQEYLSRDESDLVPNASTNISVAPDGTAQISCDVQQDKHPKTFQGISHFAAWLLFKQIEKESGFKHIVVPNAYLVHIPGRPQEISDKNYCVAQELIGGLEDVGILSEAEKIEVLTVLRKVGIFDCNRENIKRRKLDGKIVMLDFEQPANSNPRDFFHQNYETFKGNGDCALYYFADHFQLPKK